MFILVGIASIYLVIAGHQRFGFPLFHDNLECSQVNLPQGALIHHRIHGHTAQLLAVDRKMLRAGINAFFLDSPYVSRRHLSRQIWVL